jgi:hypothetical protein
MCVFRSRLGFFFDVILKELCSTIKVVFDIFIIIKVML